MRRNAGVSAPDVNQSAIESPIIQRPWHRRTCHLWTSIWISMRILPLRSRVRWLRALVGTLLALHVGLAQAGMAHSKAMHAEVGLAPGAATGSMVTARCHGQAVTVGLAVVDRVSPGAASSTPAEGHGARHTPCCESGDCHCVAACYHSAATAFVLIGLAKHNVTKSLDARATPPPQLARELRPPISL